MDLANFIDELFPTVDDDERSELLGTAMIIVAEREPLADADGKVPDELAAALREYYQTNISPQRRGVVAPGRWRERRVGDLGGQDYDLSDEEKLSAASRRSPGVDGGEIAAEVRRADEEFDHNREAIRESLPPILFEAFERSLDANAPAFWTAGYRRRGLERLCWRALIRLRWRD